MDKFKEKLSGAVGVAKDKASSLNRNLLVLFITIAFLALFAYKVYQIQYDEKMYRQAFGANEQEIAKLKEKQKKLDEQKIEEEETIQTVLHSAADAGRMVANLQNNYRELDTFRHREEIKENATLLDAYFSPSSKNARVPWYDLPPDIATYYWTFLSTYSFAADEIDVIWVAQSPEGEIYAYTTGVYDVKHNYFKNVSWGNTYEGAKLIPATPGETGEVDYDPEKVMNLAEQLKNAHSDEPDQDPETLGKLKDAQDAVRDQMREEQRKEQKREQERNGE